MKNIKPFMMKNKVALLMIFCVLTFAHFATRIVFGWHIYLDVLAARILPISGDSIFVKPWVWLTNLGGKDFVIPFIVIMLFVFVYAVKDRTAALMFPFVVSASHLLNTVLKDIFLRPRPEINTIVYEHGMSFPSGHSMTSLVCYGFVAYVLYQHCKTSRAKIVVVSFFSLLIIMIGISRIVLGAHYFSDVISGFAIGAIVLQVMIIIYAKVKAKYPTVWPLLQKENN